MAEPRKMQHDSTPRRKRTCIWLYLLLYGF